MEPRIEHLSPSVHLDAVPRAEVPFDVVHALEPIAAQARRIVVVRSLFSFFLSSGEGITDDEFLVRHGEDGWERARVLADESSGGGGRVRVRTRSVQDQGRIDGQTAACSSSSSGCGRPRVRITSGGGGGSGGGIIGAGEEVEVLARSGRLDRWRYRKSRFGGFKECRGWMGCRGRRRGWGKRVRERREAGLRM